MNEKIILKEMGCIFNNPDYKSIIKIGDNVIIHNITKFNWFQKKMIKLFFGFEVKDYER